MFVLRLFSTIVAGAIALPVLAQNAPFAPFAQEPFTDVPESHASYEAIESLREANIIRGYLDGTFRPDTRINRAEFVYLISNPFLLDIQSLSNCINSKGLRDSPTIFYPDVDRDKWFAPAVCNATEKNIVKGYPDGLFRPGDTINFVEAAKILSSVFALQTAEEEGDRWFDPYVRKLSNLKVIPTSIETYGQTLTRGEMAEMLYRLKNDVSDRPSRNASSLRF